MKLTDVILIFLSVCVLFFCFWTVFLLVYFFSSHTALSNGNVDLQSTSKIQGSYWIPLLVDWCLLSLFIIQHHFQAKKSFQRFINVSNFDVVERLLYNVGTCLTLQMLMRYWQPIHSLKFWNVDTSNNLFYWWAFATVHFLAWFNIYVGCLIMDMPELLGFKQVYYSIQGWQHPLKKKSKKLQRFCSHMRHPSFSCIVVILFVHPIMEVDRFVLASALMLFMFFCFEVDEEDYYYQRKLLRRKKMAYKM